MNHLKAIEEKEEKVKEEKKEEEKAKAAEEEKEKDSTIISYANKKVRVTLPKDLTSFHTPAREISRYSYMEESNVLGYSLYAKDRTFTIRFPFSSGSFDEQATKLSPNPKTKKPVNNLFLFTLITYSSIQISTTILSNTASVTSSKSLTPSCST